MIRLYNRLNSFGHLSDSALYAVIDQADQQCQKENTDERSQKHQKKEYFASRVPRQNAWIKCMVHGIPQGTCERILTAKQHCKQSDDENQKSCDCKQKNYCWQCPLRKPNIKVIKNALLKTLLFVMSCAVVIHGSNRTSNVLKQI